LKNWTLKELQLGFKNKDKNALARAITLVESTLEEHQKLAQELLQSFKPKLSTYRIGISGTPGVGKSTFIETFGLNVIKENKKVAVLAVDPTSEVSGGSILGDKTRMELLTRQKDAFIRPTPSGGTLGGVARRTREAILLCEAFGFDVILIETVGVGQSETTVAKLVDCFVMLLQPGAGDDLQGIKRGILELVDLVVVTKADGDNVQASEQASHHYRQALHILRSDVWSPPVLTCSAIENKGMSEIWMKILEFYKHLNSGLESKRSQQNLYWLDVSIQDELLSWFKSQLDEKKLAEIKTQVRDNKITISQATETLINILKK
jgi:LAO/AO transport system kinase